MAAEARSSTAFFPGASGFQLSGTNIFAGGDVLNYQEDVPNHTDPVRLILSYSALDALVDSKQRYDPPRCGPQTRDEIIQEIIDWVSDSFSPPILWLRGSAGCGKSAICQTIAELFGQKKTLIASFFFSRAAGSSSRSSGDCLIPTIVFQLRQSLPETRSFIDAEIRKNPIIFTRARGVQMASLFVQPLQQQSIQRFFKNLVGQKIRLIVLDGWDECRDPEVQCDLLRIIADAASTLSSKVRILIASRPEAHITHVFETYPTFQRMNIRQINLDEDRGASRDILHFIRDNIRQIKENHPLRNYLDPSWPSDEAVNFLISKASPQFILASTVMTYISDLEDRPDTRLEAIINALSGSQGPTLDNPFENLDKVYRFIFTQVKAKYRHYVWCILGGIHASSGYKFTFPIPSPNFFETLFKLPPGEVYLMLNPLLSLLSVPKHPSSPIKSLHASLFDFLLDPHRSGDLALNMPQIHLTYVELYGKQDLVDLEIWKNIVVHGIAAHTMDGAWSKIDPIFVSALSHVLQQPQTQGVRSAFDHSQDLVHRLHILEYASTLLHYYLTKTPVSPDSWMASRLVFYRPHIPVADQFHNARGTFKSSILQIQHCVYVQLVMKEFTISHRVVKLLLHQTTGFTPSTVDLTLLCHLIVAIIVITFRQGRPDIKLSTLGNLANSLSRTRMVVTEKELITDCRQLVLEYLDRPLVRDAEIDAAREVRKADVVKAWNDLANETDENASYDNPSTWIPSPYLSELLNGHHSLHQSYSTLDNNT